MATIKNLAELKARGVLEKGDVVQFSVDPDQLEIHDEAA